jgi:hypothetical protein
MIVELIEELHFDRPAWYTLVIDGNYITGSGNLESMQKLYEDVSNDPSMVKTKKKVLKSDEINVSLEQENN